MKVKDIKPPLFRATINEVNQITIPAPIRNKYNIDGKPELVLELKGVISKTEKIKPVKNIEEEK